MKPVRALPVIHPEDVKRPARTSWLTVLGNVVLHGVLLTAVGLSAVQLMAQVKAKRLEVVHKQQEMETVHKELAVLEERNRQLKYSVQYLKTDDGIEKVAREKLDLVKPGEVTFQVIPPPAPAHPRPTPVAPAPVAPAPQGWMQVLISHF